MISKIREGIINIFGRLKGVNLFDNKDVETLEEATYRTVEERGKRRDDLQKVNLEYIKNLISLEEYSENRKKIDCYETHINLKSDKNIINKFLDKGLFREDKNGIFLAEPFWHAIFNFIDDSEVTLNNSRTKQFLKKKVTELTNYLDILHPLNERKYLADDVAILVGQESSLIYSNTPAIFNPFEFEKKFKNFSMSFASAVLETNQPTFYIWNEKAILNEVASHVKEWNGTKDELIQAYFDHFYQYTKNNKLRIYWGDNSEFTKSDLSLPYISENQLIIGIRENGKIVGGVRINLKGIRQSISTFPAVGRFANMPPSVLNALIGFPSFSKLRNSLVDKFSFNKFEGTTTIEVIRFIEHWIDKAWDLKTNFSG